MHQIDATSVLIVAVVPTDKPALFDDAFDIYSKKETSNEDEWTKVCRDKHIFSQEEKKAFDSCSSEQSIKII